MTDATLPRPGTSTVAAPPTAAAGPGTTSTGPAPRPRRRARRPWPRRERVTLAGLLLLGLVPVAAGGVRLTELAGDPVVTEANARFVTAPVPVVVHIVTASLFTVLGALQLAPTFRRRHLRLHRLGGRVAAPAGLVAALSGLWMTVAYDGPPGDGTALAVIRLLFGTGMAVAIVLAVAAVLRRDILRHRAWMIRGYAIGLGAGTQVFTHAPLLLLGGVPAETPRAVAMGAGWVINVVVAEVVIRRGARRRGAPQRS